MGDVDVSRDNALIERFFGSLKQGWIFKVHQPTCKEMTKDVWVYIQYYNLDLFRSSSNYLLPVQYEKLANYVSAFVDQGSVYSN